MTVRDYMKMMVVNSGHQEELDKDTECLSIYLKKSVDEIEAFGFKKRAKYLLRLKKELEALATCKKRKCLFTSIGILKSLDDVTDDNNCFAQYKDVKFLLENGGIEKNLNKLLACIYRPLNFRLKPKKYSTKNFKRVSEKMLDIKVNKAIGAVFFYSRALNHSMIAMEIYLQEMKKEITKISAEAEDYLASQNNGDGITQPTNLQNLTESVVMR